MKDEKNLQNEKILENRNAEEILNDDKLEKISGDVNRRMFESIENDKFSKIPGLTASVPYR